MSQNYTAGDVHIIAEGQGIGNISRPFVYSHLPAVIEESPDGFSLLLLENNRWEEKHFFTIEQLDGHQGSVKDIQVLVANEKLHFFVKLGDTIFYREGLPAASKDTDRGGWQPVAKSGSNWYATLFDDQAALFFTRFSQNQTGISGLLFSIMALA